jgi:hypothetical protein
MLDAGGTQCNPGLFPWTKPQILHWPIMFVCLSRTRLAVVIAMAKLIVLALLRMMVSALLYIHHIKVSNFGLLSS